DKFKQDWEPRLESLQTRANADPEFKFRVLLAIIGIMLICGLLMCVAAFGTGYLSTYLSTKAVQRLRNHAFVHMVNLDMAYFSRYSPGSLISLVLQDVQAVDGALEILFSSVI